MTKLNIVSPVASTQRKVKWNRPMAILSFVIAFNLASMPLKAYLTEAFPWTGALQTNIHNGSSILTDYSLLLDLMQFRYNNETITDEISFYQDNVNYTTLMRWNISITNKMNCEDLLPKLPGALFFGPGIRHAICLFHINSTLNPLNICQRFSFLGNTITLQCLWSIPSYENYNIYQTLYQLENPFFNWFKFIVRCIITLYVIYDMKIQYYIQYEQLKINLILYGMPESNHSIVSIEIFLGDPTSLILSNAIISLVFVIDFWMSIGSVGQAILQVSQLNDIYLFLTACLYGSRMVWFAYFSMRYSTIIIKKWNFENWVEPLDPTALAIGVLLFYGPFIHFNSTTTLIWLEYSLWSIGVSQDKYWLEIEIFPAIVGMTLLLGFVPVLLLLCKKVWCMIHFRWIRRYFHQEDCGSDPNIPGLYSSMTFNDFNQRLVYSVLYLQRNIKKIHPRGGSLYALYTTNSKYNRMPLFSHRSADCFIIGYNQCGLIQDTMRLSLISCLQRTEKTIGIDLKLCTTKHHLATCLLNNAPCQTDHENGIIRLHQGANDIPWIL